MICHVSKDKRRMDFSSERERKKEKRMRIIEEKEWNKFGHTEIHIHSVESEEMYTPLYTSDENLQQTSSVLTRYPNPSITWRIYVDKLK